MNIPQMMSSAKKIVSDNSPVILTALGVTGTITTAYLAAKASFKAADVLRAEHDLRVQRYGGNEQRAINQAEGLPLTNREKFDLVWKLYIPAVSTGTMTCTCIVAANYIGTKRAAALAAAYSISEKAITEYKNKVIEKIGEEPEAELRKEIAQERVKTAPPSDVLPSVGAELCHDAYSGRYFLCDKQTIRRAANDINYEILHADYARLTDFYEHVGLEPTSVSDEMGWNSENPMEILFSTVESPDGRPCLSYDFAVVPIRDPWRFR